MDKKYDVQFEIAGLYAMFNRPDTGSSFVSYPAPTWSSCKGIYEAVARLKSAYIHPVKVEICLPIKYHRYITNYGGPLRKYNQIKKNAPFQLGAYVLVDVCYRIYGKILSCKNGSKYKEKPEINDIHYLQNLFNRRLKKGQFFETPCLGWREFVPSYMGSFRKETKVDKSINEFIPSMLHSPFNVDVDGKAEAKYNQDVWIREGELNYD